MNRIYISDHGDDKNDGRRRETAIYSWKRAIKLCDGNAEAHLMQGDATLQRLAHEIERRVALMALTRSSRVPPSRARVSTPRPA